MKIRTFDSPTSLLSLIRLFVCLVFVVIYITSFWQWRTYVYFIYAFGAFLRIVHIIGYVNLRLCVHGVSLLRHCSFACTAPLYLMWGYCVSVGVACRGWMSSVWKDSCTSTTSQGTPKLKAERPTLSLPPFLTHLLPSLTPSPSSAACCLTFVWVTLKSIVTPTHSICLTFT